MTTSTKSKDFQPYIFMQKLRDNEGLPSRAKLVAYVLVSFAKPGESLVYPSVDTIAKAAALSTDTVKAALRDLHKAGIAIPLPNQRRGGGSKPRILNYPRHNAHAEKSPRTRPTAKPTVTPKGGSSTLREGGPSTHEVIKKIYPGSPQSGECGGALAPSARAARTSPPEQVADPTATRRSVPPTHARSAGDVLQDRPVNADAIVDFWWPPMTWEEAAKAEDVPITRPTGRKPGDDYRRRQWDALHAEWEELHRKDTEEVATASAACAYGCSTNGKFVHTDGTVWYCTHYEPWADQVKFFRANYPECGDPAAIADAEAAKRTPQAALDEPVNGAVIHDFWDMVPMSWAAWIATEKDLSVDRPTEPGSRQRRWDEQREMWEETERKATQYVRRETAACEYGCAALGGRFIHTDRTVWYCIHDRPRAEQVDYFRTEYAEELRQ